MYKNWTINNKYWKEQILIETQTKKSIIKLNLDSAFEFEIAKNINKLFENDNDDFYHIFVNENGIVVEKQGYNTPPTDTVEFDTQALVNNGIFSQTRDAIVEAYQYTFAKTRDLKGSLTKHNPNAEIPQAHAFYHDKTGNYPESEIIDRIVFLAEKEQVVKEPEHESHK